MKLAWAAVESDPEIRPRRPIVSEGIRNFAPKWAERKAAMGQYHNPLIGDFTVRSGHQGGGQHQDPGTGTELKERVAAYLKTLKSRSEMRRLYEMDDHLLMDIGFQRTETECLTGWPMWQMLTAAR